MTGDQGVLQGVNSRSDISHAASERHVTWNKAIRYLAGQEENKATDSYGTDTLNDGLQTSSEDDEEQPRMMSRHELNVGGLQAEYLINTEDSKTGDHDLYKPSSCTSTAAKGAQETGNSLAELIRPNVRKTTFPPKQPKGATSTTHNRKRRGEGNRHVDIHPAKSYTHLVGLPESSFEEQHRRFLVQRKQHDEMKIVKRMMA